tara:strand:+ start:451 stop:1083 length:633 start_codon:yes stop_codon:yes gene_type:complete
MNENFPEKIPIFPLSGVIYFPRTNLPLNIFETRYLKLVNDCMKTNKLMGMVQMKKDGVEVYKIGCLGKINEFQKTDDGRIIINLVGITRFEIIKEIESSKLYREFIVEYNKFHSDLKNEENEKMKEQDLELLFKKTKSFFKKNGLILNWNEFKKLNLTQQINTLSMIAPVSNEEKQKLLETINVNDKSKTLSEIIEFYLHEKSLSKKTIQ